MKNHEEQYKFLSACNKKFPHSGYFMDLRVGKYKFTIEFIKNLIKQQFNNNIFEIKIG